MSKNVLFICSQNRLRSPTAEQVFASHPGIETSSAGLNHDAENPVTPELVEWADLIFVMEKADRNKVSAKCKKHLMTFFACGVIEHGSQVGCAMRTNRRETNKLNISLRNGAHGAPYACFDCVAFHQSLPGDVLVYLDRHLKADRI